MLNVTVLNPLHCTVLTVQAEPRLSQRTVCAAFGCSPGAQASQRTPSAERIPAPHATQDVRSAGGLELRRLELKQSKA